MKKMISLILALMLVVGTLAGCSGDGGESSTPQESANGSTAESAQEASEGEEQVGPEFSYPMDGTVTLTINREPYDLNEVPEYARENYFWERIQEETGIGLEFIGSAANSTSMSEEFLLLLASGEYPDMFVCDWIVFPGGPSAALADGYIQTLDKYIEWMPNLQQYLTEHPDVDRMIRTDSSELYGTPWLREEGTNIGGGMSIRKDWLDQVGLEVPTTLEELHAALTAFKNELNVEHPMSFEFRWMWEQYMIGPLSSAFNTCYPYYVIDNEVFFGPLTEGYKDMVYTLAKWYEEGLLDTDIATVDKSTVQSKFANGEIGVVIQQFSNTENCIKVLEQTDPSYEVAAVPSLVQDKNDTATFGQYWLSFEGSFMLSMSTQTEYAEQVCRFMDYNYSPEGIMLCAYGTEGVSYEADENGNFKEFTDLVLNNPDGDDPSTARRYFAVVQNWSYPGLDLNYFVDERTLAIMDIWGNSANMKEHVFPPVTYNEEENKIVSAKFSTMETYCREQITKFILGTISLEQWDSFIDELIKLGAEELQDIAQNAYDRFMAR